MRHTVISTVLCAFAVTITVTATSNARASAHATATAQSTTREAQSGIGPLRAKLVHPGAAPYTSGPVYLHSRSVPGAVAARPKLYLVFWGRQWSNDPLHVRYAVLSFFARLHGSADRWGMLLSQYCQGLPINTVHCGNSGQHVVHPNSTPIAGVWFDDNASAPFAASPAQIAVEAARATLHFGNTSPAKNANAIYMVLSPHNTHPGNFGNGRFCAWHTGVETWIGVIPFINLPYVPDLGTGVCTTMRPAAPLDGFFSTVTHEYAESVTDLWPNRGWYRGRLDEIADVCTTRDGRQMLGGVAYDVQAIWSNATMSCRTS